MNTIKLCPVCGGMEFSYDDVLWSDLIDEWELKSFEVDYINRQQGLSCTKCGNSLRAMALALAVLKSYEYAGTLVDFVLEDFAKGLKILEINTAGGLTPIFEKLDGHKLITYPEYDIENLDIESSVFDLVIHSDTLEHIRNPVVAMSECNRVLKPEGRCIFTVPIIVDRLSRSRTGLKNSYHGNNETDSGDLIVHTEFGGDVWKYIMQAGFSSVKLHSIEYPAGIAIEATQ